MLADSNTEYIRATQFIIVDYIMYDGYYVNVDKDNDAADYYQANFSDELKSSLDRNDPFDSAYHDAMYADADRMLAR